MGRRMTRLAGHQFCNAILPFQPGRDAIGLKRPTGLDAKDLGYEILPVSRPPDRPPAFAESGHSPCYALVTGRMA